MTGDLLGPTRFEHFIGQNLAKRELVLEVLATARAQRRLADILLYGPPGLGKSQIVSVLAWELGACYPNGGNPTPLPMHQSTGAEFDTAKKVYETFLQIPDDPRGVIWLIDEVDGINRTASYVLHMLMTHGYIPWDGKAIGGSPVTIIGTTNHMASVPRALKSRFSVRIRLDYYSPEELAEIAKQSARLMGLTITEEAAVIVGQNAGGEPRKVNRSILRNAANLLNENKEVTAEIAQEAVTLSGLMRGGLSIPQVRYLIFLAKSPTGKAGLNSIAAALMEDPKDCQFEYEPYLIHQNYVTIGQGGRMLTETGVAYLNNLLPRQEVAA